MSSSIFPVIDSTLSPEHLAGWVARTYNFDNTACRLLKTNMNDSYLIATGTEQYILRVYNHRHRTLLQVTEEINLLNMLKDTVSVSYPIADAKGKFVNKINAPEGERLVVLYSFASGRKLRHITTEDSYRIGVQAGQIHKATINKKIQRTDYSIKNLVQWAHSEAIKYIRHDLEEMQFVKACETVLSKVFNDRELRDGIVHLDIWYDNMSIQDDGTITLFDFDNCGNGPLILDIGYCCMQLYFIEQDKTIYEQKKKAFIDGYRSVTPLPDSELKLIPYAGLSIWIYYLGVQSQRFDSFANIFLSENYVKMYIGRVKDWLKYNNIEVT